MDIANLDKKVDLSEGEWIGDIPDMDGVEFRVRSSNFKPFRVATAGLARRAGKKLGTDEGLTDFTVAAGKPLAEHILIDWRGVTSDGQEVPYHPDTSLRILTADDDHGIGQKFRRGVEYAADQVADKLAKATAEAEGN